MMFESHEKFKQQQLINNITISGVAPFVDEDFLSLVMAIREKLETTITSDEIYSIYSIYGSKINLIVVRFAYYGVKSAVLSKRRQIEVYASDVFTDVDPNDDSNNLIYINHHLTPHFGKLLQYGKEKVKKKTIYLCWSSSYGLLLKSSENDKPRTFMSTEAIQSFINAGQQSSSNSTNSISNARPSLSVNPKKSNDRNTTG